MIVKHKQSLTDSIVQAKASRRQKRAENCAQQLREGGSSGSSSSSGGESSSSGDPSKLTLRMFRVTDAHFFGGLEQFLVPRYASMWTRMLDRVRERAAKALLKSSRLPQAPFFSKKTRFRDCMTCFSSVRSSRLPQALFFFQKKSRFWDSMTCFSFAEVFEAAAGAVFSEKITFPGFYDMY